ncbi:exodeoxyribonuclease VII small subunit [Kiloniella laminariae]|uniref:Exodeoxyribonuclease 7 small subunit n=1 Tax=Kiloniella laminariae TaxID=454162 RepID=A0ABT4LE19_9PROT|nr:exodeoxyribonuclease VII small subunit [Kiloniella laminariae]MCZ4279337.1 exodeoxyribonuclease VII small subunit [Kiloniella laminariae]
MTDVSQSKASPADIKSMSFEEALAELKTIVGRLEQGEGKLDEAIEAYDRGAKLKAHCESKLREAQEKIEKITMGPDGEPQTEPFEVA